MVKKGGRLLESSGRKNKNRLFLLPKIGTKVPILVLFLAIFSGCGNKTETTTETKKAPIEVSVERVTQQDIKEYLTLNSITKYQQRENIRANVTGYISQMNFKIGDRINRNQVFAYVRTKEQDALAEAIKVDSSLAKFAHPISIKSNAAGVISVLNVFKNDYVAEGDSLATIVQPQSLVIQVNVPFEYQNQVTVGTECEILLQNDETINAKITGKLPTINPVAQSQTFLIALPEANLPENLNVQVKIISKEAKNALGIPKTALQTNELLTKYWVMKVVNDSLAIRQPVKPLLQTDSLVQIESSALNLNDRVVTEGSYQMQDSTLISFRER